MINRVLLRIKLIQILYAYYKGENKVFSLVEKELTYSLQKTYDLYHHLLNLVLLITNYAELRIDAGKNKLLPSLEDLNPNTRFIDNSFAKQLNENIQLNAYLQETILSWSHHAEVIKELYEEIISYDFYQEYMEAEQVNYQDDKALWRKIFRKIILTNENLDAAIEDQSIFWTDDVEIVISFIIKTIKQFKLENGDEQELLPMFRDDEDMEFVKTLLRGVLENGETYRELIDLHTKNWELDRIAFMDILIMELAISELMDFPTIPISVTLNEYIEIAKKYSTDKSGTFINGILDNIVRKLKEDKKLIKAVVIKK